MSIRPRLLDKSRTAFPYSFHTGNKKAPSFSGRFRYVPHGCLQVMVGGEGFEPPTPAV